MSLNGIEKFAPDQPIEGMLVELLRGQRSLALVIVAKGLALGVFVGWLATR